MARRGIHEDELHEALLNMETTYRSDDDPARMVVLGRTNGGRRLKLVILPIGADEALVVTVADRDEEV